MLFALDFETFYSSDYSLTKLTNTQYVLDGRFEDYLLAGIIDEGDRQEEFLIEGNDNIRLWFKDHKKSLASHRVLAHNMRFDGSIMAWRHGIDAGLWLCSEAMARAAIRPHTGRTSLAKCAEFMGLSPKQHALANMRGVRWKDAPEHVKQAMRTYAHHDVALSILVYKYARQWIVPDEIWLMDRLFRTYFKPVVRLDTQIMETELHSVRRNKATLLQMCGIESPAQLMSNTKFAELLRDRGVEPPTKISPLTHKTTYAFAKTDKGMAALAEHPDPTIQALVAARLGHKSTLMETRLETMLDLASHPWPATAGQHPGGPVPGETGWLAIPLRWAGAHTFRLSGDDDINLQNMPKKGALRRSLQAPPDHVFAIFDQSQVEMRLNGWFCQCKALTKVFKDGRSPYIDFGEKFYKRAVIKPSENNPGTPQEYAVSKAAQLQLGFGAGHISFHDFLRRSTPPIHMTLVETEFLVRGWRQTYAEIPKRIKELDKTLRALCDHRVQSYSFGPNGVIQMTNAGIHLPDGMIIQYPNLTNTETGMFYGPGNFRKHIYGGKCLENIVQALAKITVFQALRRVMRRLPWLVFVLTVHDELVFLCHQDDYQMVYDVVMEEMRRTPAWADQDLILDAEGHMAVSYGK